MAVIYIALSILSVSLHPLIETVIYSVISVGLSIIATYIVNKVPYGYYFSGKIGMGRKDESREKTAAPLSYSSQSATK